MNQSFECKKQYKNGSYSVAAVNSGYLEGFFGMFHLFLQTVKPQFNHRNKYTFENVSQRGIFCILCICMRFLFGF